MKSLNSLTEIQAALLSKSTTMIALVNSYLEKIEATQSLNAYVEVYAEEIQVKAILLDQKIQADPSSLGKLFGCVVSIKDLIVYKNHKVSAGSKILDGFESQFSATCVENLIDADALIIGRTNCDEFGMGSTNLNSYFGPVSNGADPSKIPGGSSGGAAVSVQMDTCLIALGTDTGGSVRQPASMCGVIGFKPSYGMVSRYGLVAYASSFDQVGIFAKHIADISTVMEVVSKVDQYDATMYRDGLYNAQTYDAAAIHKPRIAVLTNAIQNDGLDPEIKTKVLAYIETLKSRGIAVDDISVDFLEYLVPTYYVLTAAEASSNLSRFDGVRYGYRSASSKTLQEMYINTRTEGFGPEVKKRILLGSFVLSEAYYDAYYIKAQQVRRIVKNKISELFKNYDLILLPTTPTVAWNKDEKPTDPLQVYMADIYTVLANIAGIPAISVPLGNKENNLSFGIQYLADIKNDKKLLSTIQNLLP